MAVTFEQINAGLIRYIDSELGAKATGLTKFMVYFAAPSIPRMVMTKLTEYRMNPMFADMFDEHGNVNIDEAYKRAKEAMSKSGKVLIPMINYFADERDLEILFNSIKNS